MRRDTARGSSESQKRVSFPIPSPTIFLTIHFHPFVGEGDNLTIDNSSVREPMQCLNNVREPCVQDVSIPRIKRHRDRSVAVQLDLPNPCPAFWQLWDGQAVHWLNKSDLRLRQ
jgi:hypothetical protein